MLASLTRIRGRARSSLSRWLCSESLRSLSSDMDCFWGRLLMVAGRSRGDVKEGGGGGAGDPGACGRGRTRFQRERGVAGLGGEDQEEEEGGGRAWREEKAGWERDSAGRDDDGRASQPGAKRRREPSDLDDDKHQNHHSAPSASGY